VTEKVGAQVNYKPKETNVVDIDDLWIKTPDKYSSTPGVYTRQSQENEIDLLWAGLRDHQRPTTPPIVYLGIGFAAGIIVAFIITTILFWGTGNSSTAAVDVNKLETPVVEETQKSIKVPAEASLGKDFVKNEYKDIVTYTIQPGDSLGAIATRFYKSSSPEYVKLIQRANDLKSVHSITAGKKLIIPVKD
jgi:hypothetical protein